MTHRPLPGFKVILGLVLLAALIVPPLSGSQAQIGGSISYGSSVLGTITAADQVLTYSFNGSAGDLIQATVRNWTWTLDPQINLIAPDGQLLATSGTHPLSDDPLAAALALFLPQTGMYSLKVGGEGGTTGDFVLKLQGRGPVVAVPLVAGQSVDVTIPTNPAPQYFSFEAQNCPTVLTVTNLSDGQPFTFPYYVAVRSAQGTLIAQLLGGDALEDRLFVAPASGRYEILVSSLDPLVQGAIRLLVACEDQAPGCIPDGVTSAASAPGAVECPSCFSEDFGGERCAAFEVAVTLDGGTASFTWPPVADAQYYIFSIIDASSSLLADSPILLEGATSHSYIFNPADLPRGPFTAIVSAGNEIEGHLCSDDVPISFSGQPTEQCTGISVGADIVPGAVRAVVAHWSAAPGAAAYTIHIYAYSDDGGLIGIRVLTVPGDATTYHLSDLFPSDYDRFQIDVRAYSEASGGGAFGDMPQGYLCSGSTDVEFEPLGPVQWGAAAGS